MTTTTMHPAASRAIAEVSLWLYGDFGSPASDVDLHLLALSGTTNAIWAEILSRELGDLVNVEATPVGGGAQSDWDMFVETIDLTAAVDRWEMSLGLSNAAGQRGFVFDDPVLGLFDGAGRLGW